MFIKETEKIRLVFWCKFNGLRVKIITDETHKTLPDAKREEFKRYEVVFRPMTWGMQNTARRAATCENPDTGLNEFDAGGYLSEKLAQGIIEWNLTTVERGKEVPAPVTREMIDRLHPRLAEHMITFYERQNELTDDELKKS